MRWLATALAAVLLGAAGLGLALRLYMGRAGEDRLAAGERVDILKLRGPLPPNAFLACPPADCTLAGAAATPVFDVPVAQLRAAWQRMIARQKRVVEVAADPAAGRFTYIQHTPLLRFPDIADRSSLAIFSRARYGRYDFGTNRARVERWLAALAAAAGS
jgi:hypothetical protein